MMTPPNTPPMSDSLVYYPHGGAAAGSGGGSGGGSASGSPRTSRGEGMMGWKKMRGVFGKKKGRDVAGAVEEEGL